jgi:hypothetical protein
MKLNNLNDRLLMVYLKRRQNYNNNSTKKQIDNIKQQILLNNLIFIRVNQIRLIKI